MCFFFQAVDGIRDLVRSRWLGDVYKRQVWKLLKLPHVSFLTEVSRFFYEPMIQLSGILDYRDFFLSDKICLLYTSPSPRDRTRSRMPSSA